VPAIRLLVFPWLLLACAPEHTVLGRGYGLQVPAGVGAEAPLPLLILAHGYGVNGAGQDFVFPFSKQVDAKQFLYVLPDGTQDRLGRRFWNATDACCNFFGGPVDDVAFLDGLISEIGGVYNVDPKRIFVVGHSNGAFMAYRMACARANRIAAIVSVAGATFNSAAACAPSRPVSVLQVHGTADDTIGYDGGTILVGGTLVPYPSAQGTVDRWATYDGCGATTSSGAAFDLIGDATAETTPRTRDGCPAGVAVDLWSVDKGPHIMVLNPGPSKLWAWMAAHPGR
jgi:polyhydroxybutyrate depolymerase